VDPKPRIRVRTAKLLQQRVNSVKFAVTGGTGFVGSHFLNELLGHGHDVLALKKPTAVPRIALHSEPAWIEGGFEAFDERSLAGVDCLVHLAAHGVDPTQANWDETFRVNVTESLLLWSRAVRAGVSNLVLLGSSFEFGSVGEQCEFIPDDAPLRPTAPYAASKAAATMAAAAFATAHKIKVYVLRPFQIYGPGESKNRLFPQILEAAREGRDLKLTPGDQVRDFMEVRDVAQLIHGYAHLLIRQSECPHFRTINLGTGQPTTLRAFTERVWRENHGTGHLEFGALPYRAGEVMRYVPRIDQALQSEALAAIGAKPFADR